MGLSQNFMHIDAEYTFTLFWLVSLKIRVILYLGSFITSKLVQLYTEQLKFKPASEFSVLRLSISNAATNLGNVA